MVISVSGSFVVGFFLVLISERFIVHPNGSDIHVMITN